MSRIARIVLCSLGIALTGDSRAQAPPPASNLNDVALRLMAQMRATATECPRIAEEMRPSRMVYCGNVDVGINRFKSVIYALLADPEITGGAAARRQDVYTHQGVYTMGADGRMVPEEQFRRHTFTIGDDLLAVSHFPQTKRMVIDYDLPFPQCQPLESEDTFAPPGMPPPEVVAESKTVPQYPNLARNARLGGHVAVRVMVTADGTPRDACVSSVDGPAGVGLEFAALEAVRSWRFEPARLDGKAVEAPTTVTFSFTLEE